MSPQSQQHTVEVAESPVKLAYALEWETEFLLSFYGREVTYFNVGRDGSIQMDLILENPDDPHCPLLYFNFFLPAEYPSVKPKYEVTAGTYLTPKETDNLALTLERVTDRHLGSEAIHALVESARQFMLNGRFGFEGRRAKTFKARNHETVPSVSPTILTGHCITDRSSSFQGHVAKVGSLQNVHDVMEVIKHTRKIKRAKHNCYAFRIVRANGSILEGSDDDGESGADTVLLNVLRKANITNQVIVVTRWFGGIEIGSDRFKHYRDAAHGAMALLTADKEEEAASKKGKKNKSKANNNAGWKSKKNK